MHLRLRTRRLAAGGAVAVSVLFTAAATPGQAVTCTVTDPTVNPTLALNRAGEPGSGSTTVTAEPGIALARPTLLCQTPFGPVDP